MYEDPPTSIILSMQSILQEACFKASLIDWIVLEIIGLIKSSNSILVIVYFKCSGTLFLKAINSSKISTLAFTDSSILAFSAVIRTLVHEIMSLLKSILCCCKNAILIFSAINRSKSAPPNCVSPSLAKTSIISLDKFTTETSNVPPPKS
ncbi:MAG: hypothetical protein ACD_20C00164G0001 [uncultured bacterium]|nr:MAG: hypothetical protein ACD_20C00164G0001 [uncultured bacterium]